MILALEWSSRRISAALDLGGAVEQAARELSRFQAPEAMGLIDTLLVQSGCRLRDMTEIRIGRGPGNYSGVRQAFSLAAGACAPGGIRLRAVTSGQAQAARLAREGRDRCWILGDARRGMWWGAKAGPEMTWELKTPDQWRALIGEETVVSAEAERLDGLPALVQDLPLATDLLALDAGELCDPCEPLYLHPPVSPPR